MSAVPTAGAASDCMMPQAGSDEMLARVGQMTRALHESLRGLGFDQLVERASHDIPDARDRLDYVARMTEQAAQRVLNATDAANPLQDDIHQRATGLQQDWALALQGDFSEAACRALAAKTMADLSAMQQASSQTRDQLMAIMMAQDFQDLTGQVIKRVSELALGIEQQLLQILVDYAPAEKKREVDTGLLNGPQINANAPDVVATQAQVDDLLDSLGF